MPPTILFDNAALTGFFDQLSFSLSTGESLIIITSRPEESLQLCRLMIGNVALSSGSISLFNSDISAQTIIDQLQVRQKIAFILPSGGLISNLKMWENIMLPLFYHTGEVSETQEKLAEEMLDFFGYKENVMVLPAKLSLYEKRMTAFIRAVVQKPEMIIYADCFEGISESHGKKLLTAAQELSNKNRQISSLYISSSSDFAEMHTNIPCHYIHKTMPQKR